ncbi:MAG: hypothetical protein AAFO07_10985 [Bacteroidota bacterium]
MNNWRLFLTPLAKYNNGGDIEIGSCTLYASYLFDLSDSFLKAIKYDSFYSINDRITEVLLL